MDCKKIQKKLIFLAERSLPQDEEKQMLSHLENCAVCRKQYEFLLNIEKLITEERSADVSPYFYTRLSGKLQTADETEEEEFRPAWIKIAHGSILALIIVAAVFSGFKLGQNDSKYLNNGQTATQNGNAQKVNSVTDEQLADNFPTY
jgi:hypothetical protein